jgi:putative two-component system response regulator
MVMDDGGRSLPLERESIGFSSLPAPVVMVADDDATWIELISTVLEREGYEVITCSTGSEVIDKLECRNVDAVLLEYLLGKKRGDEILLSIRSRPWTRHLPVMIVTSPSRLTELAGLPDLGADGFLTKPFETNVLLAHVRAMVRMKRLMDDTEDFEDVLTSLSTAIEAKDPYTRGHSERVSFIAELLACEMCLDLRIQRLLRRAGLTHDIGKLLVDLASINKPGKLTRDEWTMMKSHPELGARICAPLRVAWPLLPLIRHHHERLDGTGYPDGLVEDQIKLPVRILSVADVYDALTTARPYRAPLSHRDAIEKLHEEAAAGSWDDEVVRTLARIDPELVCTSGERV